MPLPIIALAGLAIGAAQAISGGIRARKARRNLERLQTPTYTPVKSVTDYYDEAQKRYQESPYQSNLYKMQAQNIQRGTAQGMSALQDRRGGQAGISNLIQIQNDALLKAGVAAEQQKDQRFNQYGSATGAVGSEQRKAWEMNQMMPYQKRAEILSQQASGGAQLMNAGIQNAYGGLQTSVMAGELGNNEDTNVGRDYSSYEYGNPRASRYRVQRAAYQ